MDYALWVQNAIDFHSQLGKQPGEWQLEAKALPPIEPADLEAIEAQLRHKAPATVREFLLSAASGIHCRYVWHPEDKDARESLGQIFPLHNYIYGGPTLCWASDFQRLQSECLEGATETWIDEDPTEKEIWLNAFPLVRPNGDMIALDLRENQTDPPVINLAHDDKSQILSESFDQFLEHWATISYVGPEIWLMEQFLDPQTKLLAPDPAKAERLRKLLTGEAVGM